ncbi:MAG: PEP-CTERM sorting domain-containing protein [Steroidobacteraceae bacterium]|nr:PEP-CTERM sorting domain-containing protein [Deltaproteobacteria bacterium]
MLMMATSAMAIPISGTIDFTGSINLKNATGLDSNANPVTAATATGIHFIDSDFSVKTGLGATGDYTAITEGTDATYTDFFFKPTMYPTPVNPLWTITKDGKTYSFSMTSVLSDVQGSLLSLTGKGLFDITGGDIEYDQTPGNWIFNSYDNGVTTLAFSASSAVPEPGTMVLLGAGLLGLAVYGKRRTNNKEA